MRVKLSSPRGLLGTAIVLAAVIVLYVIHTRNYLLFHGLTEVFSVVIAFAIFIVAWNGRRYLKEDSLLVAGIAYLFIGFLDLLHTFGYTGMGVFQDYDFYANQLWIAARFVEAVSLVAVFFCARTQKKINPWWVFGVYFLVTGAIIYSVFFSNIFPECFVAGSGQTRFKIMSEYVIMVLLVCALVLARRARNSFNRNTYRLLVGSILLTIASELSFTFYVSNYGFSNMVGHYSKIASFILLYRAIVVKAIREPYNSIFRELNKKTLELQDANDVKARMFSVISHDVRNPLTVVSTFLGMLSRDSLHSDSAAREFVSDAKEAMESAIQLTQNLLSWASLEMNGAERRFWPVNLRSAILSSIEPLKPAYRRKNVELDLSVPEDIEIVANEDSLEVVFRNILSNAVKFSFRDSSVSVAAERTGSRVRVVIRDHGEGATIPSDLTEVPVGESRRGTEEERGSGLGLTLIKRYTEENGGHVTYKSEPGAGTEVALEFNAT